MALNEACYTDSKIGNSDSIYELMGNYRGGRIRWRTDSNFGKFNV